jgi:hypothetical protein
VRQPVRNRQARRQRQRLDSEQVDQPRNAVFFFGLEEEIGG